MRDEKRDGGVTEGPLMRVKDMNDRGEICITSNSINIEYVTNIHAAVQK